LLEIFAVKKVHEIDPVRSLADHDKTALASRELVAYVIVYGDIRLRISSTKAPPSLGITAKERNTASS
jgi:hypothetical protein